MKKLMIIVAALMIAGGISAHGYCGYHGGGYYHGGYGYGGRVVVRAPYYDPYVAVVAPPVYGYGPRPVYRGWGGYHSYYRGGRFR